MKKYSVPVFILSGLMVGCGAPKKFQREPPFAGNYRTVKFAAIGHTANFDNLDEITIGAQMQQNTSGEFKSGLLTNKDTTSFNYWINVSAARKGLTATAYFSHRTVMQVKTPTTLSTLFPNEENRHRTLAHRLLFAGEYKKGKEEVELKELAYVGEIQLSNGMKWSMLARGEKKRPITAYVISNGTQRIMVQPWWQRYQGRKRVNGVELIMDGTKLAAASDFGSGGEIWFANGIHPETELVITTLVAGIWRLYPSIAPQLPKSVWDE